MRQIKGREPRKSDIRLDDNLNKNGIKVVLKDQILKNKKKANEWRFNKKQESIEKDN